MNGELGVSTPRYRRYFKIYGTNRSCIEIVFSRYRNLYLEPGATGAVYLHEQPKCCVLQSSMNEKTTGWIHFIGYLPVHVVQPIQTMVE